MTRALLAIPVLLLAGSLQPAPPAAPLPAPAAVAPRVPPAPYGLPQVTPPYRAAAVAVRQHDFLGALKALEPLTERDDTTGRHARVVAGLYAHSLERPGDAARLLGEEPDAPGPLEDWRLWVLADCRAATGDSALGLAALDRLLGDFPDSALWPRAVVRAAQLARQAGALERAQDLVALGRSRRLPDDLAEGLERVAWDVAVQRGDREAVAAAATQLLIRFPLAANELGVPDRFPVYLLPPAQLLQRADTQIAHGMAADAVKVLEATPADHRDLDWHLAMARALTVSGRGASAAALLDSQRPEVATEAARLELARAQAELAQAPPPGTKPAPPPKAKSTKKGATTHGKKGTRTTVAKKAPAKPAFDHRKKAWEELDRAADVGDKTTAAKALRALFRDQAASGWNTTALATWKRLHALDPDDTSGIPFLWERGWNEYRDRHYEAALRWWDDLLAQPPRERYPRAARYWSARAHDAVGEHERAHALYLELVSADTTDFYRRHALLRLAKDAPRETVPATAVEAWPSDRKLERARYLTDVGLDRLADTELQLVGGGADERARAALQAVVLSREGRPRPSMEQLRVAFPALGTPLQASVPPEALELYYPLHFREPIEHWAQARSLPVPLVLGVIRQESAFDLQATSSTGARGLMQLMPGTARELAGKLGIGFQSDRLYDPDYSVRLGTSYLADVMGMFDDSVELALAGYNSGPYRLKRLWRESPRKEIDAFIEDLQLEEPKTYVKRILLLSDSYSRLYPELAESG